MEKPRTPTHTEGEKPELRLKEEYQTPSHHNEETKAPAGGLDNDVEAPHVANDDNSDGRVNWTWKQIIATISLCGVYVGEFSSRGPAGDK